LKDVGIEFEGREHSGTYLIYKRTSVFMLPVNIFGEHIVAVLSFLNK
jgi:hypothetical protein